MSIPFTQYLMPDGRRSQETIDRPADIEEKAQAVMKQKRADRRPSDDEVQEAFASAVCNDQTLANELRRTFGITDPERYANAMEFTQATLDGEIPRHAADPMLPLVLWSVWRSLHNAGLVYNRRYL